MSAPSSPIRYSTFECYTKPVATAHSVDDWSEFVLAMVRLREYRPADDHTKKLKTVCISPALYGAQRERCNEHVIAWGRWIALDIDNDGVLYTDIQQASECCRALGLNFLAYPTTKARPNNHRFRLLLETDRETPPEDAQRLWKAVTQWFVAIGPDPSCKDISRLYGAPSMYLPSDRPGGNPTPLDAFECEIGGKPLCLDDVLSVFIEDVKTPAATWKEEVGSSWTPPPETRPLPPNTTILDSPVVRSDFVTDYLNLTKGQHHAGLYTFMTRIAGRAKARGYAVAPADLVGYARELDNMCPIKTNSERWGAKIAEEARRALGFAGK